MNEWMNEWMSNMCLDYIIFKIYKNFITGVVCVLSPCTNLIWDHYFVYIHVI